MWLTEKKLGETHKKCQDLKIQTDRQEVYLIH